MTFLILGLILFLGVHSLRIVADPWRAARIAHLGEGPWKGLYSLVSIVGFVFLLWGFGRARAATVVLWSPPFWTHYVALALTLVAFVLIAAAYVPGTRIKGRLHHPMVLGVKVWAFAHLISNGTLADVILFGSFLVWAIAVFGSSSTTGQTPDRPCITCTCTCWPAGISAGLPDDPLVGRNLIVVFEQQTFGDLHRLGR